MSAHTPGPWMYVQSKSKNVNGYIVPLPRPDGMGLVTNIATIRPHVIGTHEVEANARLIAAAPELYEALEAIERALHDRNYFAIESAFDAGGFGSAALRKARGES